MSETDAVAAARAGVLSKLHVLRAADGDARHARAGVDHFTGLTLAVAEQRVTDAWAGVLAALDRLEAVVRLAALTHKHRDGLPRLRCTGPWCAKENAARAALAALPREQKER